jgi:hypothetical protein
MTREDRPWAEVLGEIPLHNAHPAVVLRDARGDLNVRAYAVSEVKEEATGLDTASSAADESRVRGRLHVGRSDRVLSSSKKGRPTPTIVPAVQQGLAPHENRWQPPVSSEFHDQLQRKVSTIQSAHRS